MSEDYRNTPYCPKLVNVSTNKSVLKSKILAEHPRAKDMHAYISDNDAGYKKDFLQLYNGKCGYCGASYALIPFRDFEVDHFVYEKSAEFPKKADAGYIENLVLSCQFCNRNKSSLEISQAGRTLLHPDSATIRDVFVRSDDYYIKVADEQLSNTEVLSFYNKLLLASEIHRLDYLLMSLLGLYEKKKDKPEIAVLLGEAIELLRKKRNLMEA